MNANKWFGIGHVTRDPEIKTVGSGSKVAQFRLACNRSYKKGDDWIEKPMFIDCEAWSHHADKVERSVKTGTEIFVMGRLESDEWTHKDSGEKRGKHKIYVLELQIGRNRKDGKVTSNTGDSSEGLDLPF